MLKSKLDLQRLKYKQQLTGPESAGDDGAAAVSGSQDGRDSAAAAGTDRGAKLESGRDAATAIVHETAALGSADGAFGPAARASGAADGVRPLRRSAYPALPWAQPSREAGWWSLPPSVKTTNIFSKSCQGNLKVHKSENFFGSNFEFCTFL